MKILKVDYDKETNIYGQKQWYVEKWTGAVECVVNKGDKWCIHNPENKRKKTLACFKMFIVSSLIKKQFSRSSTKYCFYCLILVERYTQAYKRW